MVPNFQKKIPLSRASKCKQTSQKFPRHPEEAKQKLDWHRFANGENGSKKTKVYYDMCLKRVKSLLCLLQCIFYNCNVTVRQLV